MTTVASVRRLDPAPGRAAPRGDALASSPGAHPGAAHPARRDPVRLIADAHWDLGQEWRTGDQAGRAGPRRQRWCSPTRRLSRRYRGTRYDVGQWTSAWTSPGFGLTELIASWQAATPGNSWIEVRVRGRAPATGRRAGTSSGAGPPATASVRRTSVPRPGRRPRPTSPSTPGRSSDAGRRRVVPGPGAADAPRPAPPRPRPSRRRAARGRPRSSRTRCPAVSKPGAAAGIMLDVPRYSQMVHAGHSPSTAAAARPGARRPRPRWCSATTTRCPAPASYTWVGGGHTDPWVDQAARATYDKAYEGTGNWPFNTAYAASLGRARLRHPARVAARGRAVRRRRHPAGRRRSRSVGGAARRRADLRRPPATCW